MPHSPQTLISSSGRTTPLSQTVPPEGSAGCLTPRKPLFLRPEAPRPQPKQHRRRGRRGASPPANPCSFVRKHHALSSTGSAGGGGVVPHPSQTLVPSSGSTTPSTQTAPPVGPAWCLTPRKPLFLRPDAPRPQSKQRRRRDRRGASPPAKPYSFVRKHHALSSTGSAGGGRAPTASSSKVRAEPPQLPPPPGPGRSPSRVFRRRSRHNSWK